MILPIFMMPPRLSRRDGSKVLSVVTTKKDFEKLATLKLSFLALKNDTSSAKESLQFFPDMNTYMDCWGHNVLTFE